MRLRYRYEIYMLYGLRLQEWNKYNKAGRRDGITVEMEMYV